MENKKAALETIEFSPYYIEFNFSSVSETLGRTIVLYESPYTNGAFSDDTGAAPARISFVAKFRGANYDDHFKLVEALQTYNRIWRLYHPNYTSDMRGRIEKATIAHDTSRTACHISIDFIITNDHATSPEPIINAARSTDAVARAVIEQGAASMIAKVKDADTNWLALLEERVAWLEGLATEYAAPLNSITSGVKFVKSLPGRMAAAVMGVVEAFIAMGEALASSPEFLVSVQRNADAAIDAVIDGLKLTDDMAKDFKASCKASYAAIAAAYFSRRLQADADGRRALMAYEAVDSWTPAGQYLPPRPFDGAASAAPEYLSSIELEAIIHVQATLVQEATIAARDTSDDDSLVRLLAQQQRTISDFVQSMILQTGSIIEIDLGEDTVPIFILLERYGLSYKAADRVHALNPHIENPIFYTGKVKIYES